MSIADKQIVLKNIEKGLFSTLTAKDLQNVLEIVSDELSNYDLTMQMNYLDTGEYSVKDDLLEAFLTAKEIEGRSSKTLERYRYIITDFLKSSNVSSKNVTVYHLRKYLIDNKNRGLSDVTINGYRDIFCSYFNWLQKETLININPCSNLNKVKCIKEVKSPYSDIDIERLKMNCCSIRDLAIVCFLLSTGCRIQEVVQLNRRDVDFQNMQCKVLGKGNKERIVYIDNITAMHLKKYLSTRNDIKEALFTGRASDRMTPGGVRAMLVKLGQKAGVENVHPHRFRRTLATNLINRGMSIQEVAFILGHDKLDTTMKYVFINQENVKNAYRKYL